jgi:hypothetical protein
MALTDRQQFKLAMIQHFLDKGLTDPEKMTKAAEVMVKQADGDSTFGSLVNAGKGLTQTALRFGIPLALATPPLAGAAAGYGLGRLSNNSTLDPQTINREQLIEEYKRQAERLARNDKDENQN